MTDSAIAVRDIAPADFERWATLFRGYREFYRLAPDEHVITRVWSWLGDPTIEVRGVVAEREGAIIGIAHYRTFHRPSTGTVGIYLDDLFTAPEARGGGAGRALLAWLGARAGRDGRSVVRWITATDNETARQLYDRVATATGWVTYDLAPTPTSN
jgi:GNAT superfamily N-acetyltransferase